MVLRSGFGAISFGRRRSQERADGREQHAAAEVAGASLQRVQHQQRIHADRHDRVARFGHVEQRLRIGGEILAGRRGLSPNPAVPAAQAGNAGSGAAHRPTSRPRCRCRRGGTGSVCSWRLRRRAIVARARGRGGAVCGCHGSCPCCLVRVAPVRVEWKGGPLGLMFDYCGHSTRVEFIQFAMHSALGFFYTRSIGVTGCRLGEMT